MDSLMLAGRRALINPSFLNLSATLNSLRGPFHVPPSLSLAFALFPFYFCAVLSDMYLFSCCHFWTSKSNAFLSFAYKSLFFLKPPPHPPPVLSQWLCEPNTCSARWKAALDMRSSETAAFKFPFLPSSSFFFFFLLGTSDIVRC